MKIDELIQLDESRIDKTDILQQIEKNLALHKLANSEDFPTFHTEMPILNKNGQVSAKLIQKLTRLNDQASQLWLDPQLPPATTVMRRFLNRLKRPFHQLVVFYVNQIAQQQNEINDQMRQVITQLIVELNQPDSPADS